MRGRGYLCECDFQFYPDTGGRSCVRAQSPFFTTTIIVSICILFAAVAIGVVMQIRSNMQRWVRLSADFRLVEGWARLVEGRDRLVERWDRLVEGWDRLEERWDRLVEG